MSLIEPLEWDSLFFKYKVGKIQLSIEDSLPADFYKEAKSFKLVYVFSEQQLSEIAFPLVDQKITLLNSNTFIPIPEIIYNNIEQFNLKIHSYSELEELALQSGKYSRFKVDRNFQNGEFEKLYGEWIKKLVFSGETHQVWVKTVDGVLGGFIGVNLSDPGCAIIELIAVSPQFRGKGIGNQLMGFTFEKMVALAIKEVKVVTQEKNQAALYLYRKFNFKTIDQSFIYHYWP